MVKGHSIDSSLQPRASGKPAYMIRNLLSGALALIAIIGVVVATTYLFAKPAFAKQGFYNVLSGATAVYFFSNIALYKLGRHPGNRPISYLLPILAFNLLIDRKSTRLNSSHVKISYAVFCLKKKKNTTTHHSETPPT